MAKNRRNRGQNVQKFEGGSEGEAEFSTAETSKELCPQCKLDEDDNNPALTSKEDWVRCDACKVWFHWRCAGEGEDLEMIDKWFCKSCMAADAKHTITRKPPARKSSRKKAPRDYASLHNGVLPQSPGRAPGTDAWRDLLLEKEKAGAISVADPFRRMHGSEVSLEWLNEDESAFWEPIVVENPDGLGMQMPDKQLTIDDIANLVGENTPVEVMDVATQSNTPGYTLGKWAAYYNAPASAREKILNVISLEVSETELGSKIVPPRIVRELDWVEKFWPANKRGKGHAYPKVQLYCLMGVAKAWTDWHVDFAGSSVYYHIFRGSKIFYFINPSSANLAAYERWSGSELQTSTWLGDLVDQVYKVELQEGNTMVIPTGWIHSVYTPMDTLVFGGNFLHSYNIPTQLRVREIELATRVPKKFRFPFFTRLCWYVADSTLRALRAREDFAPRVLASLCSLCDFLMREVHAIERGDEHRKKDAREHVPGDRVRDAPALARELRWRLHMARNGSSDSEHEVEAEEGSESVEDRERPNGVKRKRGLNGSVVKVKAEQEHEDEGEEEPAPRFRNFVPKRWDVSRATALLQGQNHRTPPGPRPQVDGAQNGVASTDWAGPWIDWTEDDGFAGKSEKMDVDSVSKDTASVERKRDVLVRVRKTAKGLERQRIERTVEVWEWPIN